MVVKKADSNRLQQILLRETLSAKLVGKQLGGIVTVESAFNYQHNNLSDGQLHEAAMPKTNQQWYVFGFNKVIGTELLGKRVAISLDKKTFN